MTQVDTATTQETARAPVRGQAAQGHGNRSPGCLASSSFPARAVYIIATGGGVTPLLVGCLGSLCKSVCEPVGSRCPRTGEDPQRGSGPGHLLSKGIAAT